MQKTKSSPAETDQFTSNVQNAPKNDDAPATIDFKIQKEDEKLARKIIKSEFDIETLSPSEKTRFFDFLKSQQLISWKPIWEYSSFQPNNLISEIPYDGFFEKTENYLDLFEDFFLSQINGFLSRK